jgi:hypothetical protein
LARQVFLKKEKRKKKFLIKDKSRKKRKKLGLKVSSQTFGINPYKDKKEVTSRKCQYWSKKQEKIVKKSQAPQGLTANLPI